MITLYGVYRSRATRPLWLLGELGLPFTHVPVIQGYRLADPLAADAPLNTQSPEFLKISPQGAVPVMDDDGLILTESLAITLHIARKFGGDLGPQTLNEVSQSEQWALFAGISLDLPGVEIMYVYLDGLAQTPEGAARIATNVDRMARSMARLETELQTCDWLMGDRFTVADIMVAECLRYGQTHSPMMEQYPATTAWINRCQARPAFKMMMTKRLAESV